MRSPRCRRREPSAEPTPKPRWTSATESRSEGTYPSGKPKRKQFWKSEFVIVESGKEPEARLGYSNFEADEGAETVKIQDLLAEFGAQGWELLSETVLDTTIVSNHGGWSQVGTPIQIRWILKRRVES